MINLAGTPAPNFIIRNVFRYDTACSHDGILSNRAIRHQDCSRSHKAIFKKFDTSNLIYITSS